MLELSGILRGVCDHAEALVASLLLIPALPGYAPPLRRGQDRLAFAAGRLHNETKAALDSALKPAGPLPATLT